MIAGAAEDREDSRKVLNDAGVYTARENHRFLKVVTTLIKVRTNLEISIPSILLSGEFLSISHKI